MGYGGGVMGFERYGLRGGFDCISIVLGEIYYYRQHFRLPELTKKREFQPDENKVYNERRLLECTSDTTTLQ